MKNLVKVLGIIAVIAMIGLSMASCASRNYAPLINLNGDYVNSTVNVTKTGSATSKIWLGFIGTESFPSVAKVAQDNGIKKIATVEYNIRPGILGLWTEYTTIVSGE